MQAKICSFSLARRLCACGAGGLCDVFADIELPAVDAFPDTPIVAGLNEFVPVVTGRKPRQRLRICVQQRPGVTVSANRVAAGRQPLDSVVLPG